MKTHRTAHWIKRIGVVTGCLVIAVIAVIEFKISDSWARQADQLAANQNGQAQTWYPNVSVGDFFAAGVR
jgi:hypothetical protein